MSASTLVSPLIDPASAESWLGAWRHSADCAYCRSSDGRVLAANQAFARKFGHSTASIAGTEVCSWVHPDDRAALEAASDRKSVV